MKESTLVTLNKVVLMEMENLNIMMAHFMRVNGKTALCMAKESYIKQKILQYLRVISWKAKRMELES